MIVRYDKRFKNQYQKLPKPIKIKVDERLRLFIVDRNNPLLRNHPLKGRFNGYFSINITGDLRALYYEEAEELIIFSMVGTHSQLYG